MKISRIKIENFRSISQAEFNCNDFNVFVGQNNHGKTNLFEAIDWFYNKTPRGKILDDLKFGRKPENKILVEIEFTGAQEGLIKMKNEKNSASIKKVLGEADRITIQRSSDDERQFKIIINGTVLEKSPTGFDNALKDFLPNFEYIHTKLYYDSVAKFSKTTPVGIMLSGVLTAILEKSEEYQAFQSKFQDLFEKEDSEVRIELDRLGGSVKLYLEKQFPDCTKVTFEVTPPVFEDLLKNFDTTIDDGIETNADEKGDGMQRALMLAIIQAYAEYRKKDDDLGKTFLFFIDEAELHLHPSAQRMLKNVLLDIAKNNDQVFINTHSSVLVVDGYEIQQIFKVEKINKETDIRPIDDVEKPHVIFELLGGSPSDLLLPRNFILVEGKTEFEFLRRVLKRHYSDKLQIQIIQTHGDIEQAERSVNSIEKLFTPLGMSLYKEKTILLYDQPHADKLSGFNDVIGKFPYVRTNNQLFTLPVPTIEEYYPNHNGWRKSATEANRMNSHQKTALAKQVGDGITKEQFEGEMLTVYEALKKCWESAYN